MILSYLEFTIHQNQIITLLIKKKDCLKANRIVHRSTYLDVPVEFLGQPLLMKLNI